jgi:hypothetical protein
MRYTKKIIEITFISLFSILILVNCDSILIRQGSSVTIQTTNDNDGGSEDTATNESDNNTTKVSFLLPDLSASKGLPTVKSLYAYDLTGKNKSNIYNINQGLNEIRFPKDGIFILNFLDKSDITSSTGSDVSKNLTNGINSIGNIKIVSADLISVPLKNNSEPELSLGELSANISQEVNDKIEYSSNVSLQLIEETTKYTGSELEAISDFDIKSCLSKNPDINQNGILDTEEGMTWSMYLRTIFFIKFDSFNFDTASFDPIRYPTTNSLKPGDIWLHFENNFLSGTDSSIELTIPNSIEFYENGIISLHPPRYSDQFYFQLKSTASWAYDSSPPYNGNYLISAKNGTEKYEIRDVTFNDNMYHYDGIYLILLRINKDTTGNYTSLDTKWIKINKGKFVQVNIDEVINSGLIRSASIGIEYSANSDQKQYYESLGSWVVNGNNDDIRIITNFNPLKDSSFDLKPYHINDQNIAMLQNGVWDVNGSTYGIHFDTPNDHSGFFL